MSSNPYEQRPENAGTQVPTPPPAPEAAYTGANTVPPYYGSQSVPQQPDSGYGVPQYHLGQQPQYPSPYDGAPQGHYQHDQASAGERHAKTALICGIIGILIFGLILGPIAIWQARKAEELGVSATPGKVTGWVAVGLSALVLVLNLTVGMSGSFTVG